MIQTSFVVSGEYQVNCYIIYDDNTKKAIIVDPGQDGQKVIQKIESLNLQPELLINTHGHFDHIDSDDLIRNKYNIPLAIHKDDTILLTDPNLNAGVFLGLDTIINKADIIFEKEGIYETSFCSYSVIHTPGHTEGSVCILIGNYLFAGDTLFKSSIGRTDFYSGSYDKIISSLNKLKTLPKEIVVCPGHGPFTTIKEELANNPYLR